MATQGRAQNPLFLMKITTFRKDQVAINSDGTVVVRTTCSGVPSTLIVKDSQAAMLVNATRTQDRHGRKPRSDWHDKAPSSRGESAFSLWISTPTRSTSGSGAAPPYAARGKPGVEGYRLGRDESVTRKGSISNPVGKANLYFSPSGDSRNRRSYSGNCFSKR
jgi:hypothetical protein